MELTSPQEAELEQQFQVNRTRMFKGTIAVCAVYGFIALVFVILMFTTAKSKDLLGGDLFAFSVTFIAGVLFIVGMLVVQIMTFKKEKPSNSFDLYQCPDFWELKPTDPQVLKRFPDELRPYLQYYCEPSAKIFDQNTTTITTPTDSTLKTTMDELNVYQQDNLGDKQSCRRVYPGYMAYKDGKINPEQPTKLRCEFSKHCNNAPWSSVCQM